MKSEIAPPVWLNHSRLVEFLRVGRAEFYDVLADRGSRDETMVGGSGDVFKLVESGPSGRAKASGAVAATKIQSLTGIVERLRVLAGSDPALAPERVLAERLGVKRHQLRRALGVLRAGGEIDGPRRRKSRRKSQNEAAAASPSLDSINPVEIMEMRLVIEPALARLAALRASPKAIEAMRSLIAVTDADRARETDIEFHTLIATASGNTLSVMILDLLGAAAGDGRLRLHLPERIVRVEAQEHHAILAAITARDAVEAERAMAVHLGSANRWLAEMSSGIKAA